MATHYELLGVAPGASHDEIQRAYRKLARDHHPDTKTGEGAAAAEHARQIMASVNAAWTVLGDPARRAAYDQQLNRPAPPRAGEPAANEPDWDRVPDFDVDADWDEGPPSQSGPGDLIVLVPAVLFAASIGAFAFSLMSQSSGVMAISLVVLLFAGVTFLLMPFVMMLRRARARAKPSCRPRSSH